MGGEACQSSVNWQACCFRCFSVRLNSCVYFTMSDRQFCERIPDMHLSLFVCASWSLYGCLSVHACSLCWCVCVCVCRCLQGVLVHIIANTVSLLPCLNIRLCRKIKQYNTFRVAALYGCVNMRRNKWKRGREGKPECVFMLKRKPPWWDKQLLSVAVSVLQGWLRNHSVRKSRQVHRLSVLMWGRWKAAISTPAVFYTHAVTCNHTHMNTLHRHKTCMKAQIRIAKYTASFVCHPKAT